MGFKDLLFVIGILFGGIFSSCSRNQDVKIDFNYKYRTEISIPENSDSTISLSGTIPFSPIPEFVASPHQVIGVHVSTIKYGYYFIECLNEGQDATFSSEIEYYTGGTSPRKFDLNGSTNGKVSSLVSKSVFNLGGSKLAELSLYVESLMLQKGSLPFTMDYIATNTSSQKCSFFIELSFSGNAVAEVANN